MGTQDGYIRTKIIDPQGNQHIVEYPDRWYNIRQLVKFIKEKLNEYSRNKEVVPKGTQISSSYYLDLDQPRTTITIIASENNPNDSTYNGVISNDPSF